MYFYPFKAAFQENVGRQVSTKAFVSGGFEYFHFIEEVSFIFHSYFILHYKTVGFPFRNSAVHDAKRRLDIFVRSEWASHARLACVDRSPARFTLGKIRVVLQSNFTYFYPHFSCYLVVWPPVGVLQCL